jgi:hypothetical protein
MRSSRDELNAGSLNIAAAKKRVPARAESVEVWNTERIDLGELIVKFRQSVGDVGRLINLFDSE